jgi:hypothetical protein
MGLLAVIRHTATCHLSQIISASTTTILMPIAYNARMVDGHNSIQIRFSPLQHARVSLVLAVVLFLLAAGSYYWNEAVHYRIYLVLGLIFAILGFAPLLVHAFQPKSK